ncbi:hypothetical protein EYF80_029193 [Liparis tanakae]|uniref:Uncharacterized protein n=1 Tax=Liparis tanakae TaxID=230148 RepID=A0A4Z2H6Z3_9TELE|nr:hypothetical protein EYF80_029193 [Liparis tanakae]
MEKTDREAALRDETMPAKCKISPSAGVIQREVVRVHWFGTTPGRHVARGRHTDGRRAASWTSAEDTVAPPEAHGSVKLPHCDGVERSGNPGITGSMSAHRIEGPVGPAPVSEPQMGAAMGPLDERSTTISSSGLSSAL